eukprot:GDKI01026149.1.p1 GENE.GDKI01026149.1~~GDKI01026149.1.p1  ORF type:complete len:148 (+),score=15.34 GDKI01026149.1:81-524(+)
MFVSRALRDSLRLRTVVDVSKVPQYTSEWSLQHVSGLGVSFKPTSPEVLCSKYNYNAELPPMLVPFVELSKQQPLTCWVDYSLHRMYSPSLVSTGMRNVQEHTTDACLSCCSWHQALDFALVPQRPMEASVAGMQVQSRPDFVCLRP